MQTMLESLNCGRLSSKSFAVIDGREVSGIEVRRQENVEDGILQLQYVAENLFEESYLFHYKDGEIICRREFKNTSGAVMRLAELGLRLQGITFGGTPRDDFFYHNENPRIYEVMAFPVDYNRTATDAKDTGFDVQAGNRWADPGVICDRIGRSPYQPFPAIVLGNFHKKQGLVHGTLSQRIFYHNYQVRHEGETLLFDIYSSFKDIAALELAPGRILVDEWYLGSTEQADEIEHVFEKYANALRKVLPPMYGATAINRDNMVWGSWNDGVFRKVSEELVLREAAFLKKHFPTVRWIQLDDGYCTFGKWAHGLGVPYEGEAGVDPNKFPNGLRHLSDEIRRIGLRPAIWIGGFCPHPTKIYQEHPEWFIDYSYRVAKSSPLDVSQPEVREYMTDALDTLCTEYGFESVKHDFWSYAFEDSHDLYKNKNVSGYEMRDWWLKEVRKRLAGDGYLQTGCDIVMGNPFLGEHFTNYRYGIDIGSGKWDYVKINFLWGVACFATHTGDLFVPNSDAIGLFPGLNETEAMFCINYCLVTHTMVEIAGLLSQHQDSPRVPILKKAVCNPNNGQDVYFGKWDYLDGKAPLPCCLYFKTAHFCPKEEQYGLPVRTAGLFNLDDEPKVCGFSLAELGLPEGEEYILTDVWSGERLALKDGNFRCELPAHGSRLIALNRAAERLSLLDANIRILRSEACGNGLKLYFDYGTEAELHFASAPGQALLNGQEIPLDGTDCLKLEIPANAVLEVR